MAIERVDLPVLDEAYVDRTVTVTVTPVSYDSGGPRAPFRVRAADSANTWIDLVYFGQGGSYAKKLLPLGEPRVISGRLDRYGQALQMAHPDFVVAPAAANTIPRREPVYGLTEGLTNKRMGALVAAALERAPELPEWIEPSVLARHRWPPWRAALAAAHALRGEGAPDRLAYDELLANQLALLLVRASTRRRRGRALPGTGRLTGALVAALPWPLTGAQRRAAEEIRGDLEQAAPMLRLLQGDVGAGKTLVALLAMLTAVEVGRAGGVPRPDRDPCPPARGEARRTARRPAGPRRAADRPGQRARAADDPRRADRRQHRYPDRHPRDLPGGGDVPRPRAGGGRRAAQVRRQPAAGARRQGDHAAAPAGDDRDADPADAGADRLRRDGRVEARRTAAGPAADRHAGGRGEPDRRRRRRSRAPSRGRRAGLLGLPARRGQRGRRRGGGDDARGDAARAVRRRASGSSTAG